MSAKLKGLKRRIEQLKQTPAVRRMGWFVCSLAAVFYCYEYLLRIEPSVMMPELMRHYSLTSTGFGLLSGLFYWAYTPLQAVVGMITDYKGPRKVLTAALFFCVGGCLLFGLSNSIYLAGLGRFLIGFGSAFAFVGVLKLAAIWLPHDKFAFFVGLATSLGMLGAMIGDIGLTYLSHTWGWQKLLVASAVVGVVLIPLFMIFVHDKGPMAEEYQKETFPVLWQGLLKVVREPIIWKVSFVGFMLYLSLSAFAELWGIPFLRIKLSLTQQHAADLNALVFFGWFIGGPLNGWLTNRIQSRRILLIIGSVLATVSVTVLIYVNLSIVSVSILLFLFGVFSSAEIIGFSVVKEVVEGKSIATAIAFMNMVIMMGGMLMQPLLGFILDHFWLGQKVAGLPVYTMHSYKVAFALIPIGLVLAIIMALMLPETYREHA